MTFLAEERAALERFFPGLDQVLANQPMMTLEQPNNPGLQLFREANGPAFLIPESCKGLGGTALDAIQVQRAIASRSPSLAIASTMHHFSIATIAEMSTVNNGMEALLLEAIAQQGLLVASGFAEGRASQGILQPTMQGRPTASGVVVTGSKKPCSLAKSMDLLTASVAIHDDCDDGSKDGDQYEGKKPPTFAVVLVPAQTEGIERRKFWDSWLLAGAESDEVVLNGVEVPEKLIFRMGKSRALDETQIQGFLWFELLISASYLGVASALVERVLCRKRSLASDYASLGIELEGAMAALEGVTSAMMSKRRCNDALARSLFVRYLVQGVIERVTQQAAEALGGMAYITSPEVSYLLAAARALAFHPPSKASMAQQLADHLTGDAVLAIQ